MIEPYGANEVMRAWIKQNKLRYRPHARCLHWVSKGRCGVTICTANFARFAWMDHTSGWTDAEGHRFLLCQPYGLRDPESLAQACKEFELDCRVSSTGWYGWGTVCISLAPRAQKGLRLWSAAEVCEHAGRLAAKNGRTELPPTDPHEALAWWQRGFDRQSRGVYGPEPDARDARQKTQSKAK